MAETEPPRHKSLSKGTVPRIMEPKAKNVSGDSPLDSGLSPESGDTKKNKNFLILCLRASVLEEQNGNPYLKTI